MPDSHATIEEPLLSPKRSYIKRGCGSGCGCLLLIALIVTLVMRASWGPAQEKLRVVPREVSSRVPLFTPLQPATITLERDINHHRTTALILAFPKLLIHAVGSVRDELSSGTSDPRQLAAAVLNTLRLDFQTPSGAGARDRVTVEWAELPENIDAIKSFYVRTLADHGYAVRTVHDDVSLYEVNFYDATLQGRIEVDNYDLRHSGVERVVIVATVPRK